MIVIGVDPGTKQSAWTVFDGELVIDHAIEDNAAVLTRFDQSLFRECERATGIVFEQIEGMGMPVGRETFETVFWTGRFFESAARQFGGKVHLMTRRTVKLHLCGHLRAKDGNIRQALIDRLGKPGTSRHPGPTYGVSSHGWSALALAVTFHDQHASPSERTA